MRFSPCLNRTSDKSANGTVSGNDIRMMIGYSQDSNCAARIKYMNTNDSPNASKKPEASSDEDLERPVGTRRYSAEADCLAKAPLMALTTSLSPKPGATLAMKVTWRCRPKRLTCDGPVASLVLTTEDKGTVPY